MTTLKTTKINQLLQSQPTGVVLLSSWLAEHGYSFELQKHYRKSNWLQSIGQGAHIRFNDSVSYEGAVYALQKQAGLNIHPGGRTALSLLGKSHYLELAQNKVVLFGMSREKLPVWFINYPWGIRIDYYASSFLPPDLGLTEIEVKNFTIKISSAARALMECLYLSPYKQELLECFNIMEGLNNLHPKLVQSLLISCQSIKVKRLFLYLAEKADHAWFNQLDLNRVELGKGKRSIVKNGVLVDKYEITIPKELASYGKRI